MASIDDVTTGTVNGTGYFDKLMQSVNAQLESQFRDGRLQGKDFANVYLGSMQAVLAQSVQLVTVLKQTERVDSELLLLEQRLKTEKAQILDTIDGIEVEGSIGKQKALHKAQTDGFSRDAEQKALKILMDGWSVTKSVSGDSVDAPDGARNDDIEDLIIKLRQGVGITTSIYKTNADAGDNQTVEVNSFVELDGTKSTSPTDLTNPITITTWSWTLLSNSTGEADPSITDADSSTPTLTAPNAAGVLVYRLEITASDGEVSYDTVTITVEPLAVT